MCVCVSVTHQDIRDVLRLHDEELIVADDGLKELQRDRGVLEAADAGRHKLEVTVTTASDVHKHLIV